MLLTLDRRSNKEIAMNFTTHYQSSLGGITLASDGEALVGLWSDGQKYFADTLEEQHTERDDIPIFDDTRRWLDIYFSGKAARLLRAGKRDSFVIIEKSAFLGENRIAFFVSLQHIL